MSAAIFERFDGLAKKWRAPHLRTLDRLDYLTDLIDSAEAVRAALVDQARTDGESWAKIGARLGITKQAAQQRYGRPKGFTATCLAHTDSTAHTETWDALETWMDTHAQTVEHDPRWSITYRTSVGVSGREPILTAPTID
jgi:hypothetical protein